MSNENSNAYHADKSALSSSALKIMLKDGPAKFHEYRVAEHVESTGPALVEGSYVHSIILEPHTLDKYAVFPGLRKAGAAFDKFKEENKGKIILSAPQVDRSKKLVTAYEALPTAIKFLSGGMAEFEMRSKLMGVDVKAKADYINSEEGYIVDVKTTSMPSGVDFFKATIQEFQYDLSASLYVDIGHRVFSRYFDFYWIVLSKSDFGCEIYKAASGTTALGRTKYNHALALFNHCMKTGVWDAPQKRDRSTAEYEIEEI